MLFKTKKSKIFCISFQRTGTTSVGGFFKDHGFKVAGYNYKRSMKWSEFKFLGDYEAIFRTEEFQEFQVYEDNPWWETDFYKYLFHRFPDSKFILFERNSDKWFDSMMSHSNGKTLGNAFRHSKLYNRGLEFYERFPNRDNYRNYKVIDNLLELKEEHRKHYTDIYDLRNKEILEFFEYTDRTRLVYLKLEDPLKWIKLGAFF
ncbi:sulfotransferase [Bizionia psychrotolerans]|uniref:sulfotransferase n=1 Tax=Bizionia psychrotolerans TaxID=1492901 RepID=UPI0006518989|nr:sulfotransferase [Bizionia psychrotolerans]